MACQALSRTIQITFNRVLMWCGLLIILTLLVHNHIVLLHLLSVLVVFTLWSMNDIWWKMSVSWEAL